MSQADLANRLNEAIALINAGRRAEGRTILIPLSQQYPDLEQIWMWMAASSETTEDRIAALRRVLGINPRNDKARAALTQLTGEAPPLPESSAAVSPGTRNPLRSLESWLLALLAVVALVAVILLINAVVGPLIAPKPTATPTYTATITFTPSDTFTPTITPGGPTFTPIFQTLPPSWTPQPEPSAGPTRTLAPTFTPRPTSTITPTVINRPTITTVPSYTPGGPSDTPGPPTETPIGGPTASYTPVPPTASPTS